MLSNLHPDNPVINHGQYLSTNLRPSATHCSSMVIETSNECSPGSRFNRTGTSGCVSRILSTNLLEHTQGVFFSRQTNHQVSAKSVTRRKGGIMPDSAQGGGGEGK